ncbi:hypothetical protein IT570_02670 [Candidatus Sumerlaeota bacterium]|nr:hypothetical protein [Candidatus Sumerlaeota bacterium]
MDEQATDSTEEEKRDDKVPGGRGPLTWVATPGVPVYGHTPATLPPDLEAAWVGQGHAPAAVMPAASVYTSIQSIAPIHPVHSAPPASHPISAYPAPSAAPAILNPATGEALTPEARAAQLGVPYPPAGRPPAE